MLFERRMGQIGKQRAVEAAYVREHGEFKPYHRIAVELLTPERYTADLVRKEIAARYGVEISEKTANHWLNTGRNALQAETADRAAEGSEQPAEAAP